MPYYGIIHLVRTHNFPKTSISYSWYAHVRVLIITSFLENFLYVLENNPYLKYKAILFCCFCYGISLPAYGGFFWRNFFPAIFQSLPILFLGLALFLSLFCYLYFEAMNLLYPLTFILCFGYVLYLCFPYPTVCEDYRSVFSYQTFSSNLYSSKWFLWSSFCNMFWWTCESFLKV